RCATPGRAPNSRATSRSLANISAYDWTAMPAHGCIGFIGGEGVRLDSFQKILGQAVNSLITWPFQGIHDVDKSRRFLQNPPYVCGYMCGYQGGTMARHVQRLTRKAIAKMNEPGYHPDGHGLYLQISSAKTKSWIFRYMLNGRAREMGLGSMPPISLA